MWQVYLIWIFLNQSSSFMWERRRRRRGRRRKISQAPHKEVAFSQQHSQFKGRRSSVSSACFKNVVFSLFEVVKAGPCSNFNRSHTSLFFFSLCVLDMTKKYSESDWSASLLVWSPRQLPTQTSALCLFSDCHALFASLGNASTQKHTDSHSLLEVKGRRSRGWSGGSRWGNFPS